MIFLKKNNMKIFFLLILVLPFNFAIAKKIDDFKKSVSQEGCKSIPYSDLRDTCGRKWKKVYDYCKSEKIVKSCEKGRKKETKDKVIKEDKYLEDLKDEEIKIKKEKDKKKNKSRKENLSLKLKVVKKQIRDTKNNINKIKKEQINYKNKVKDIIKEVKKCIAYRESVMAIYQKSEDKVKNEKDEDIIEISRKLRNIYYASRRGHAMAIKQVEKTLSTCRKEI